MRAAPSHVVSALALFSACSPAPVTRAPVESSRRPTLDGAARSGVESVSATCHQGTAQVLGSLTSPMHVDAYVTKGLPRLAAFVTRLQTILDEYVREGAGRFDYRIVVPRDEATRQRAKDAGLVEQPLPESGGTTGFMGLAFRYGEVEDSIRFLPPDRTDGLEFWLANKMRELRDKKDGVHYAIGVLTGHDEIKLSERNLVPRSNGNFNLQDIITQNFPYYRFQEVDLRGGDAAIADELQRLILTQPSTDLTEKELRRIDEFLMKGKAVAAYVSSVNVKPGDASMNATLDAQGLERLFDGYGIELRRDALLDMQSPLRLEVPSGTSVAQVSFPPFPVASGAERLDTSLPLFFHFEGVAMPFASSIVIHPEKQPQAKVRVVARTTARGVRVVGQAISLNPFQRWKVKEGDEWGQYNLAAVAEGSLRTAFAGPVTSAGPARVFVLSSSQFLANPLARAGNGPDGQAGGMLVPNVGDGDERLLVLAMPYAQSILTTSMLQFKDTLDWLVGDADLLACASVP